MKKIIITENQLKRIFLKEDGSDKILYQDENLSVNLFEPRGGIKLGYGENYIFYINVVNKSNGWLVLRADGRSEWGLRGESELKFTQKPIAPGSDGEITFKLDVTKKSDGGSFVSTFILTYIVGKVKKDVIIRVPYERPSREDTINYCKGFYNDTHLTKAKATLLSWLNNSTTREKFMKNWGKQKKEVDSIFQDYVDAVKRIKLEYDIKPNEDFLGQVEPRNFNTIFKTARFVPITINCVQQYLKSGEKKQNIQPLLIHEMQHLLNLIHPWHPEGKTPTSKTLYTGISDAPTNEFGRKKLTSTEDAIINRLVKDGFTKNDAEEVASDYLGAVTQNGRETYVGNDNELASFIFGFRTFLNKKPGDQITAEELIKYKDRNQAWWLLNFYVQSGLPLKQFLMQINSYAKNNPKQSDTYNV